MSTRRQLYKKTTLSVTEALAVLLQTWNSAYYRYHRVNSLHHFKKIDSLYARHTAALMSYRASITVVIFCWHILLISESMDHHDSEIMDDRSID